MRQGVGARTGGGGGDGDGDGGQIATEVVLKLQQHQQHPSPSSSSQDGIAQQGCIHGGEPNSLHNSSQSNGIRDEDYDPVSGSGESSIHHNTQVGGEGEGEGEGGGGGYEAGKGAPMTIGEIVSQSAQSVKEVVLGSFSTPDASAPHADIDEAEKVSLIVHNIVHD